MQAHIINLRKIGIMFLIFTLVFTGIGLSLGTPVSYAASSEVYVSSSKGNDTTGDGSEATPYATLQKAYPEVSDGGTIYLLDDITLTGGVEVVVAVNEAKHITIATAPGSGKNAVIKRGQPSGKVLFQLTNASQLTLRDIIIDGNSEEIGRAIDGRLFNIYYGSKLTIDEGAILQNSHSQHQGSAIYTNSNGSIVEMKGGQIRDNKRDSIGAAILVDPGAQFIMTGGLITDNTGGGVQSRGGQISLSGDAVITGNINSAGRELNVNLMNHQALVLAGEFTGEAGITTQSMTPGTKFGRANDDGLDSIENLIADSGALLASYDANNTLLWRSFKNEISKPSTNGEILGKRPILTGVTEPNATVKIEVVSAQDQSLVISEEVTADANGNWTLAVSKVLDIGKYTITVSASNKKTQSEPVNRQFEVSSAVYVSRGGDDTAGEGTQDNPYATLYKAYQEVIDGGTIYVMDNIDLSVNADKKYLHLNQNKSVTISTDPNAVNTAVIKRGSARGAASGEPGGDRDTLIHLEQGQLTLNNIIIDAAFGGATFQGRIMNVYGGKLVIEDGAILRNSPSDFGGSAIYFEGKGANRAVIEMNGGEITGNKHTTSGSAAVSIVKNADFIMTGGKITNNSGGGIDLSTNTDIRFVLSGTAYIKGNTGSNQQTERNVYLPSDQRTQSHAYLTLNDNFTGKAGITAQNRMDVGLKFGEAAVAGLTGLENLIADNNPLLASYGAGNNDLVWRLFKNEINQPSTDGEITGTKPTLTGVTEPFAEVIIEIVSPADPSFVITEKRTADANGNWELPIDALNSGAYTVTVTANKNETQSNPVNKQFVVVDKAQLQDKVTEINNENLVEAEYTPATWQALQDALNEANRVLNDGNATQQQVDDALTALEDARSKLDRVPTPPAVDKTQLENKVTEINNENLVEAEYTPATWQALQDALNEANRVLNDGNATQQQVDDALTALEEARSKLDRVPTPPAVDKTQLKNKVTEINNENLVEAEYTPTTWQALQDALDEANRVLNDGNATQQQVNDALTALEEARSKLDRVPTPPAVDTTQLKNKVTEINNENLVEAEYTPTTWQALQDALDEANRVLNDGNATQQQVNDALTALEEARSKLDRVPTPPPVDKTQLQNKVTEINNENLVEAEYTPATWQALQDALNEANRVLNDRNATQQQVDDALTALEDARSKLDRVPTPPPVDKTQLQNKVTEINNENLVEAEYTPVSWQALQDALQEANRVLANENATQEQVNKALQAVSDARGALVRRLIVPSKGNLSPAVSTDVYNYTMTVDYSTTELRFTVNPVTPDATITLNGNVVNSGQASEPIALNVGSNEITIVITEKDGTTSTYTITVTRAAAPNGGGNNGGGNNGNNGNNGGSGSITTPPPSPAPSKVEKITVNVEASGKGIVAQTVIERTTNADGTKSDKVTFEPSKATEAVQKTLAAGSTAVRIVIPDENDEVKDVRVELPAAALKTVHESGLDLEIYTDNGLITIPNASLRGLNQHLYFHLVPIKQENERKQVEERAKKEQLVREVLNDGNLYVVDRPFTIETNMPSRPVLITLPMNSSHVPTASTKRELFLANLAIFIEHSDGERKLVTPEVGDYTEGKLGLTFGIEKFSTFSILNLNKGAEGKHSAYMIGFTDGTFKPSQALTRAQIAMILSRVLDLEPSSTDVVYPDVPETHWASEAVRFATATGLMQGMPDGSFQPEKAISRAEMATIIARLQDLKGAADHSFSDVSGHWAEGSIANVFAAGYMEGMPDGSFQPNKTLTRAEAVVVFNRLLNRGPLYGVTASWSDVPASHWAFHHIEEASRDHSYITRETGGETIVE